MAMGAKLGEPMTATLVSRPIRVAAQRIEGIIAIDRRILINRRARTTVVAVSRSGGDPSDPLCAKSPAVCGGARCAVVSLGSGLLGAVGTEDASDGEFCERSNDTVPVGKSSANKSEVVLPKLPERLICPNFQKDS
jgi:hypothetical protein